MKVLNADFIVGSIILKNMKKIQPVMPLITCSDAPNSKRAGKNLYEISHIQMAAHAFVLKNSVFRFRVLRDLQ